MSPSQERRFDEYIVLPVVANCPQLRATSRHRARFFKNQPLRTLRAEKSGVEREVSVIEAHLGGCDSSDACDESARKQSRQPGCEPNAAPSRIGDGPILVKCLQRFSDY